MSSKKRSFSELIHPDLAAAQKMAYEPSGLVLDLLSPETESEDYGAFEFEINHRPVKFRAVQ